MIYFEYLMMLGIISTLYFSYERKQRNIFFVNQDKNPRREAHLFSDLVERMNLFYKPEQIASLVKQSGLPFEISTEGFILIQVSFIGFFVLILWVLSLAIGLKIFLTILLTPVGYFLPILFLHFLKRDRQTNFLLDFRDFKRMMILGLEAGLSIQEATSLALKSARGVFKDIVEPVYYRIGFTDTMVSVFYSIYDEIGLDEVRMFASLVLQAERNGTPIITALQGSLEREWKDKENNLERVYQVRQNVSTLMIIFFQFGPMILSMMVVLGSFIFTQLHKF